MLVCDGFGMVARERLMVLGRWLMIVLALTSGSAAAQATVPLPTPSELAEAAAKRFPQPVRVGDLIGREVLQPTEAQHVLGRVEAVTTAADGMVSIVMSFGGFLGIDTRLIAVPVDAMALLGQYVAVVGFTPEQLSTFPTAPAGPATPAVATIRVGLVRPFH